MGVRVKMGIMDLRFIDIDEMIANAQQVLGRRRQHIESFFFFRGLKTRLSSKLPNIIFTRRPYNMHSNIANFQNKVIKENSFILSASSSKNIVGRESKVT